MLAGDLSVCYSESLEPVFLKCKFWPKGGGGACIMHPAAGQVCPLEGREVHCPKKDHTSPGLDCMPLSCHTAQRTLLQTLSNAGGEPPNPKGQATSVPQRPGPYTLLTGTHMNDVSAV